MYAAKKIVSDLSVRAVNKRMKSKGFTNQRVSKLSKYVRTYWKPDDISDRIIVIFQGQLQRDKQKNLFV